MAQNPIYVASGGGKNNRTLVEARSAERKLALIGCPSLGIVAEGNGGQRVAEGDFEANEIDPALPLNLGIRTSWGDGSTEENSIADQGEFQNVDKLLDTVAPPKDPIYALKNLIGMVRPGLSDSQVEGVISSLPGVSEAKSAAVLKAWNAA